MYLSGFDHEIYYKVRDTIWARFGGIRRNLRYISEEEYMDLMDKYWTDMCSTQCLHCAEELIIYAVNRYEEIRPRNL